MSGFAFAWAEFWIVRPGNVGAIAFVMARYARELLVPGTQDQTGLELLLAEPKLCTDNAAMIASAARYVAAVEFPDYLGLDAFATAA